MRQYTECYLYYSCMESECDARVRDIWAQMFEMEVTHLHHAAMLLKEYEGTEWQQVIPGGEFPEILRLSSNIGYVRKVLAAQVELTAMRENYVPVGQLPENADFFRYQGKVNADTESVASHRVIGEYIRRYGTDYRCETQKNPIVALRDRRTDNTSVGRAARCCAPT